MGGADFVEEIGQRRRFGKTPPRPAGDYFKNAALDREEMAAS